MWYNKYVGLPYASNGRDESGVDCWGLVRLIYSKEFNVDLPSFVGEYAEDDAERQAELIAINQEGWKLADNPIPGDVVLFKILGKASHVGIYLGEEKFLHTLDNYASAIERLTNPKWVNRVVGVYSYTENKSAKLVAIPSPLQTKRITVPVAEGTTILELKEWITKTYDKEGLSSNIVILQNGKVVPLIAYPFTKVQDGDQLEYRAVAQGRNILRLVLTIAVAAFAAWAVGTIGTTGFAAGFSPMGKFLTSMAINVIGGLLINALVPIKPPPPPNDPGQADKQLLINGGQNQANRYGAIPVVLGKVRLTAPLASSGFVDSAATTSDLRMMLCWGFGPLKIESMQIGANDMLQYTGVQTATINSNVEADSPDTISSFNSIYGQDVQQNYIGLDLVHTPGSEATDWRESSLTQANVTRLSIAYNFPQGLRTINRLTGDTGQAIAQIQLQYTRLNDSGQQVDDNGVPTSTWKEISSYVKSAFVSKIYGAYFTYQVAWGEGETGGYTNYQVVGYRWTRISIDSSGNYIQRQGFISQHPYQEPSQTLIDQQAASSSLYANWSRQGSKVFPPLGPGELSVADICIYNHSTLYTISTAARDANYAYAGLVPSYTTVTEVHYYYDYESGSAWETVPTISISSGSISKGITVIQVGDDEYVNRKDPFTIVHEINVPPGKYRIRTRRLNADDDQVGDILYYHKVQLLTFTGYADTKPVVQPPNSKLCLTALRIRATDQINGQIEGINALVTTICKVWNPVSSAWDLYAATNNPAALFLYVLTHPANAQRIKEADVASKINLAALGDWFEYCSDKRFTYNSVQASQKSLLETLTAIALAGRASPTIIDGKWSVIIDRPKTDIVQHFTPHNSWGFEASKALPKIPDGLKVTILNEQVGFQEEEVIVYNTGKNETNSEVFEQIDLQGTTNIEQAYVHARWAMAAAKLRPERYTLNTDLEYLVANRGDRVKVLHDITMWGLHSGRIKNRLLSNVLELDESVYLETGKTYNIRIRNNAGQSNTFTLQAVTTEWYDTITLAVSTTEAQADAGMLFMIGEVGQESADLIITSIEPLDKGNARITLADYSPLIYDINYLSTNFAVPSFNTNITKPPLGLVNSITVSPTVLASQIKSDESVMEYISKGNFKVQILIPFQHVAGISEIVDTVHVEAKRSAETNYGTWPISSRTDISNTSVLLGDVQEGDQYDIRLRYIGKDGRTGPWSTIVSHTVTGKLNPPSNVTGFTIVPIPTTGELSLKWATNMEMDVMGYEVRTSDTGWGNQSFIFQGDASSHSLVQPVGTSLTTYYVRAYDTGNRYSTTSASQSFTTQLPNAITVWNTPTFKPGATPEVVFGWSKPAVTSFNIANYKFVINKPGVGTQTYVTTTESLSILADWVGSATVSIYTVDVLGNESLAYVPAAVTKAEPTQMTVLDTPTIVGTSLLYKWDQPTLTSLPISGYEIRTTDLGWGSSGAVYRGSDLQALIPLAQSFTGTYTWYIKAIDTDSRYSTAARSFQFTVTTPADIPDTMGSTFYDTSLTSATVTVFWDSAISQFAVSGYEISYNGTTEFISTTTITTDADWLGDRTYTVKTVDVLGNKSIGRSRLVSKLAPGQPTNVTAQVIDNNVLLYWNLPAVTTLPISHVIIKKGTDWNTASLIGEKDGTFTSLNELSAGLYTYMIAAVDTDNRESLPSAPLTVAVSQPPDFIFNGERTSTFPVTASFSNASYVNGTGSSVVLPVNSTETWEQHFLNNSYATPQAQIDAGFPIYIQPGVASGYYEEVFDFETDLGASQITLTVTGVAIHGNPSVSYTISTSLNGSTYTTYDGTSAFATGFRYVKIRVTVNRNAIGDLYQINTLYIRLDAKQKTDAGNVTVTNATSGAIVNFAKEFIDVESITLTGAGTTSLACVYDFVDTNRSFTYSVTSNVATLDFSASNPVGHGGLLAGQKVRLYFSSGTMANGVYTIASVTNSNVYTVNVTMANTSGAGVAYANSFRAHVFNSTDGTRPASTKVSWSVRGY